MRYLLYSVRHRGRTIKIYLLVEHKSHPDRWVTLQLLRYLVRIWELHRKQRRKEPLPPILPLVLYHGQQQWQTPDDFRSLFGDMDAALAAYIPDFRFALCDLALPEPAAIRSAVLSRLVLLALKHLFDPQPKRALAEILPLARQILDKETALEMLEVVLRYYVQATETLDEHDIHELITQAAKEDTMPTFIDRYIEQGRQQGLFVGRQEGLLEGEQKGEKKGRQEGRQEGQQDILLGQMNRKFGKLSAAQCRRILQADRATLRRWSEQILFAATIEEALS